MICTCGSCKQAFWRYRRDWPPKGYCSLPCSEAGPQNSAFTGVPALPSVILAEMKTHRSFVHETTSPLGWFDCQTCGDLEERYAASLEYHYRSVTAAIVADAENRWAQAKWNHKRRKGRAS
jgi:hypothetical protein